jgi:glycerol 3-phosphatase-2
MNDSAAAPPAGRTLAELYDVALLDLDGVVYRGPSAVPGAVDALQAASNTGLRRMYVTNNASRPPSAVAAHLRELGIPAEDGDVVTSAQAAATLLLDHVPAGARVLVVGGEGLRWAVRERGFVPVDSALDAPDAVVQGFGPELSWAHLAEGAYALATGVPWVASNLDATFPTERGAAPGNGTFVAALRVTSGREPVVAGKPERPLFDEAVRRTGATAALVVGDRLDTDIEGADNAGLDSLLVLTGVTDAEQAILAPPGARPTWVAPDLSALHRPARRAVREGDVWRCGRWVSVVDGGTVLVVPDPGSPNEPDAAQADGDVWDAWRAACGAAHAYADVPRAIKGLPDLPA